MYFNSFFYLDDIEINNLLPNEEVIFKKWFSLVDEKWYFSDDIDGLFVITNQRVLLYYPDKTLIAKILIKDVSISIDNYQYLLTDDLRFLPAN